MPANVDSIINMVVEKKLMFFDLMDHQKDAGLQANEFSLSAYEKALEKTALLEKEHANQGSVYNTLSFQNLSEFGLAYDFNNRTRTFLVKNWFVEMLRELDHKRMISLPEASFETMRSTLKGLAHKLSDPSIDWKSSNEDVVEEIDNISRVSGDILDKLNSNVQALEGQAEKLSEIAKNDRFYELDHGTRQLKALEEIERIYIRNVLPTLSFLNPNTDMQSAIESLNRMSDVFKKNNFYKEYADTRRVIFALRSIGERVNAIEIGLKGYLPMLQSQRELYDAIEKRFNRLHGMVVARMNGREYGSTVNTSNSQMEDYKGLSGLKSYRSSINGKLFNMVFGEGRIFIDSYLLSNVDQSSTLISEKEPKFISPPPIDYRSREHKEIMKQLMVKMRKFELPQAGEDMINALHEYLSVSLDGYSLPYVFEALPLLPIGASCRLSKRIGTHLATITQNKYFLSYYPRHYSVTQEAI